MVANEQLEFIEVASPRDSFWPTGTGATHLTNLCKICGKNYRFPQG